MLIHHMIDVCPRVATTDSEVGHGLIGILTWVSIIALKCLDKASSVVGISLVTIRWQESQKLPVADFSAPHECVKFDERRIDAMQPGLLVHPTLGRKDCPTIVF